MENIFCLCRSQLRAIQRSRREGESRFRYNQLMAAPAATQNGFHGVQTSLILSKEGRTKRRKYCSCLETIPP